MHHFVHNWLRDRLLAPLWHSLFQAHFTKAHSNYSGVLEGLPTKPKASTVGS
jgi:hypothetical protein